MRHALASVFQSNTSSRLRLSLTVSALAMAVALPSAAMAQDPAPAPRDPDATELDEVIVTGLRRGLADSISIKRNETSIVEAADIQMVRGDFTFRSGAVLTTQLLDGAQPPTALICANDDMAAGALSTAHGRGLDVPGDLSITGFDDTPVSEIVWPPLTTVHQPLKAMGREAVLVLASRLSGTAKTDWRFTTLPHAVVSRRSADRILPKLVTAKA